MNTTTTSAVSRQNFFNKKLLAHAVDLIQMLPLCTKYDLPKNMGTTTVSMFRRKTKASADDVKELTEGTPDNNFSRTELERIDVPIIQYGDKSKISDIASETDLFKQLNIETERQGESCALKVDDLIMAEAVKNATRKMYAGAVDFAALKAATASEDNILNCKKVLAIAQTLKKKGTPKFSGGYYIAVLTPEQVYDLQQDPTWKDLNVHNRGGKSLYKNEIGEIHGVKILETTVGWVEGETEDTRDMTGNIFTGLFLGRDALGAVDLAGAPSARKPKFIHVRGADKTDPLDQFQTVGWKGYFAQKLLNPDWLITVRTKTLMPAI